MSQPQPPRGNPSINTLIRLGAVVLTALAAAEQGLYNDALAEAMGDQAPLLPAVLKYLQQADLVDRSSPTAGRLVYTITEKGRQIHSEHRN